MDEPKNSVTDLPLVREARGRLPEEFQQTYVDLLTVYHGEGSQMSQEQLMAIAATLTQAQAVERLTLAVNAWMGHAAGEATTDAEEDLGLDPGEGTEVEEISLDAFIDLGGDEVLKR